LWLTPHPRDLNQPEGEKERVDVLTKKTKHTAMMLKTISLSLPNASRTYTHPIFIHLPPLPKCQFALL